jgi:hypothetical protein
VLKRDVDSLVEDQIKRIGKQADTDAILPFLQSRALSQLVGAKLMEELAERHGIVVTDAEIKAELEGQLRRGGFITQDGALMAAEQINAILREQGWTLKKLEEQISIDLAAQKLKAQVAARVPVDEAWLNLEQRVRNEKVAFEAVTLAPDPAAVADPGDARLESFLKQGGSRFQVGRRRVLQYVALDPASLGGSAVDDATLKNAYESRRTQYLEFKASHILFKAANDAQYQEATRKAQELRAKLVAG